jgi:cytoskeletal protein RodZ
LSETGIFTGDESKESFGDFLRRNREASGKTLDGISKVTRISKRYLEAFENNNSKNLPEDAFARGFLKAYVKEVGLDLDDCLARYDRFHRSESPTQIKEFKKPAKMGLIGDGFEPLQNQAWLIKLLGILVVFAGLVVGIVFLIQNYSNKESEVSQIDTTTPDIPGENIAENPPPQPQEVAEVQKPLPVREVEKPAESVAAAPSPVRPSILSIKATRDGRLSLKVDENAAQEMIMKTGQVQIINVFKEIEIRTADRAAFGLLYNGKPLEISEPVIKLFNRHLFSKKP